MKINQAITILEGNLQAKWTLDPNQQHQATQLGIEALKEVKKARCGDPALDGELLPGETPP